MISALKKLARKNEDAKSRAEMPSGVTSMGQSLQRKFGRGVQYNMKIIIKGDRNTGKSTLFGRFQGKPFKEEYLPTNEIQVCSINWNYRVADDVVKVEVWDVVDKGKKKSGKDGLKLANDLSSSEDQIPNVLDAEFLDVYKGTHGCIMMLDITKQWTFKYIERELPKIPHHVPVLILANFLDMDEHRVVQLDEITDFIRNLDRGKDAALVEYGESCMKNSFGLKFIHKFFNVPFLKLQRETLEKQLKTNEEDMAATLEELSFHRNSEEQDYNKYLAYLEKKASEKKQQTSSKGSEVKSSPSSTPNLSSASLKNSSTPEINQKRAAEKKSSKKGTHTIDDFVPNETIDSGFLGEPEKEVGKTFENSDDEEDDSDSDNQGNPMVSGFQDIISSDEDQKEEPGTSFVQNTNADVDVDIEITSDESEEEVQPTPVSRERDLIDGGEKQMSLLSTKPKASGTTNEIGLNEEDSSFMDAWLDSPNTNPPDQKKSVGKSGADVPESTDLFGHNKLDVFEASKLTIMTSSVDPADGEEENSSENVNEEKRKRHSERKNKEEEESKHKHRSKHKHKKKTKTKDSEDDESTEKKSKSKRKHRHKHSKSREKKDNNENGADYESF